MSQMKSFSFLSWSGVLLVLSVGFLANAQSTNDSSSTDFSTFQLIVERNIFNPDRYPHTTHYHHESHEVPTFSLAGTMSYRKGMFAFFSGTSGEYQKVLQQGGSIAGYTVAKITFDGVQLQSGGTNVDFKVGSAMRQEGGSWELSAPGEWSGASSTVSVSSSQNNTQTTTTPPPSASAPNDILKRLMQQREQELK